MDVSHITRGILAHSFFTMLFHFIEVCGLRTFAKQQLSSGPATAF